MQLAQGYSDARVNLQITDGIRWVQDAPPETYDAIIVDSSDPVGPAEVLFKKVRAAAIAAAVLLGKCKCGTPGRPAVLPDTRSGLAEA